MLEHIHRIIRVFAENGLFNEGVEVIGSWCFHMYQKHFGVEEYPFTTQDVDFLIPRPFKGKEHKDLIHQLEGIGFRTAFADNGSLYLWNAELKIEFIVPHKGAGLEHVVKIRQLGFEVVPLRYVDLLLSNPTTIVESGVKVRMPNPTNFVIHKLIVALLRKEKDKQSKDLHHAVLTSSIVGEEDLKNQFSVLPKKWKKLVITAIDKAEQEFPLLLDKISRLKFTLQAGN